MAPLTGNRAGADGMPSELAVEYYRQGASAGLIVSEATAVSPPALWDYLAVRLEDARLSRWFGEHSAV
jgi:N-ethylmaleimide reductase